MLDLKLRDSYNHIARPSRDGIFLYAFVDNHWYSKQNNFIYWKRERRSLDFWFTLKRTLQTHSNMNDIGKQYKRVSQIKLRTT